MKFNFTFLASRFFTGFFMVVAVLALIFINNFFLIWAISGILYLISFCEAMRLFNIKSSYLLIGYAIAVWVLAFVFPQEAHIIIYVIFVIFGIILTFNKKANNKILAPFIYPTASFLLFLFLYKEYGNVALLWFIAIVASGDIGGYILGKRFGTIKLSKVSPNKTWEGAIGGVFLSLIIGGIFGLMEVNFWLSIFTSLVVSIFSILGDLYESSLKRASHIKDSGTTFCSHGGALDRLDGYIFSVVPFIFVLELFK